MAQTSPTSTRFSEEQLAKLDRFGEVLGMNQSEVLRCLVDAAELVVPERIVVPAMTVRLYAKPQVSGAGKRSGERVPA